MSILSQNKNFDTNILYLLFLSLFSFFINFYYSHLGSFPIDTFLHFDSAYRILIGELPVKDYWIVSGLTVDFIQSFFFKIFGVNWFAYSLHASTFNLLIAIFIYFFFLNLKINRFKAFIFSLSFSTLSYSISGTPFVDLHATFFLLISTLVLIQNLDKQKTYLWVLIITLFFLSFFSKQVPAAYAAVTYFVILLFYFIKKNNFKNIYTIFYISIIIFGLIIILLKICGIDLKNFYVQYLDYPRSIGRSRIFNISFIDFFSKFKFIIIPILFLSVLKFKKIKKISILSNEIFSHFIFLILIIILIFHQMMSKNQIYIYFLIPIIFAFIESEINQSEIKFKKYFSIILICILGFITIKYHLRYNENRKFHELSKIQLNETVDASKIHKSLNGLKWKNPTYHGKISDEIVILNKAQKKLNNNFQDEIMVITHYLFLDAITKKNLNYPNKTFTTDGASVPVPGNKHYNYYKNFLLNKIKEKNIKKILFLKHEKINQSIISSYLSSKCYNISEDEIFYIFNIKCLN